jgi:hypothetical protein
MWCDIYSTVALVTFLYSTNHLLHLNASIERMIVDISMDILLTPDSKTDNVLYISYIYSSTIYMYILYNKQGADITSKCLNSRSTTKLVCFFNTLLALLWVSTVYGTDFVQGLLQKKNYLLVLNANCSSISAISWHFYRKSTKTYPGSLTTNRFLC